MKWISNNDPPKYVWPGDLWYNQKDKMLYEANIERRQWEGGRKTIHFPKKTIIMSKE